MNIIVDNVYLILDIIVIGLRNPPPSKLCPMTHTNGIPVMEHKNWFLHLSIYHSVHIFGFPHFLGELKYRIDIGDRERERDQFQFN